MKKAVVLYSGGSDSTLVAALSAKKFDEIHMLTFYHKGSHEIANTKVNVEKLRKKYPKKRFIHHIICLDKLTKYIATKNYISSIIKFGFINMALCSICMLVLHTRVLIYCLDNNIKNVAAQSTLI